MSVAVIHRRVLADLIPGALVRDAALVLGGAAFTGLAAQVSIPLPGTVVPLTLQTFAVLLVGAGLGTWRALASMGLYVAVGAAGVPWFAHGTSGASMPTFGYLLGFVLAAALVGGLARRGGDRTPVRTAAMMVLGNAVIYAVGVSYLASAAGLPFATAVRVGLVPFLVGDAIKVVLAAGLLPGMWALVGRR